MAREAICQRILCSATGQVFDVEQPVAHLAGRENLRLAHFHTPVSKDIASLLRLPFDPGRSVGLCIELVDFAS